VFFHSYVSLPKGTSFCRVNMFNLKYIQRLERWIWNHEDMEPWIKGLSTPHQPLSGAHWSIARSASLSTNFPSWTYRKSFTIPYNSDFWKEKNLWFYQIHHASKGYNHLQPHFVMVKSPCFCKKTPLPRSAIHLPPISRAATAPGNLCPLAPMRPCRTLGVGEEWNLQDLPSRKLT